MFRTRRKFILVMSERWVLVGDVQQSEHALLLSVTNAATVRRWGTSQGLGQLAKSGPLPETVLDPEPGEVFVGVGSIMRMIPCNEDAWGA